MGKIYEWINRHFPLLFFAVLVVFVILCAALVWREYNLVLTCTTCVEKGLIANPCPPINFSIY